MLRIQIATVEYHGHQERPAAAPCPTSVRGYAWWGAVKFETCINELIADLVELVEPLLIAPQVLEVVVLGRIRQRREQSVIYGHPASSHWSHRPSITECTLRATSGGTSLNGGDTEHA